MTLLSFSEKKTTRDVIIFMAYYFVDERIFAKRPNLTLYGKQSSYNENETTLLLSKEYLLQPKKLKHYEDLMNSSQRPVLVLFF